MGHCGAEPELQKLNERGAAEPNRNSKSLTKGALRSRTSPPKLNERGAAEPNQPPKA